MALDTAVSPPTFRIKPYAHPKYKFVVRAKLEGKWKRSYFTSEEDAAAFARNQNASVEKRRQIECVGKSRSDSGTVAPQAENLKGATNKRIVIPARAVARKAVVILGMHRSGTSALGGALQLLGVDFGEHLAPPGKDNEKGYWEHPDIVALHDELLRSLGTRWDDDKPLPSDWLKREITRDIRSLLLGILERDFANSPLFGMKDPRMCRLLPLWFPIFQALKIEPYFILVARHPWEVAASLAKRDGMEHPKSYLLWLEHVVQAERATRGHERSFVCYEEMVDDPVAKLGNLRKQLAINLRPPSRVQTALRNFLDPSLRHHKLRKKNAAKLRPRVPQLALDLYEVIRSTSTPGEIGEKIAPLAQQFDRGCEIFYPRVQVVEAKLASLDKEIEKSEQTDWAGGNLVKLEIFHPVADGYRATESQTRYFPGGSWKLLSIDLPGGMSHADRPVRIDPVSYPALIDIAEIALKRPATGETLWSAGTPKEFDALEIAGTASRLTHQKHLRILSFGVDPQVFLPPSSARMNDEPSRLEISLRVDPDAGTIRDCLATPWKGPIETGAGTVTPYLALYADQGEGYRDEVSLRVPVKLDANQTIRIDNIESLRPAPGTRLRLRPLYAPAFLRISTIVVTRDSDGMLVYNAEGAGEFEKIDVSQGFTKWIANGELRLSAADARQSLHLPALKLPPNESYRLEIKIGAESSPAFPRERNPPGQIAAPPLSGAWIATNSFTRQ